MKSELDQIERTALRLQSIFNLLKTSARQFEGQSNDCEIAEFLGDLADFCEIGKEYSNSIYKDISELETKLEEKQWIN